MVAEELASGLVAFLFLLLDPCVSEVVAVVDVTSGEIIN
jgi:hypothetical protein